MTEPTEGTNVNGCRIRRVEEPQVGTIAFMSNDQPQDRREHRDDSSRSRGVCMQSSEPPPAVFSGRGLVKREIGDRRGGLGDGRLAERIGLKPSRRRTGRG